MSILTNWTIDPDDSYTLTMGAASITREGMGIWLDQTGRVWSTPRDAKVGALRAAGYDVRTAEVGDYRCTLEVGGDYVRVTADAMLSDRWYWEWPDTNAVRVWVDSVCRERGLKRTGPVWRTGNLGWFYRVASK